jgi:uncharacterized protein (TIGR02145 family)
MNTIKIGSQEWATEDLKVTKFRNGEDIPLVEGDKEWGELTTAAYCITPDGNHLYNWYAVNDPRGLAPEGFHVPSDDEWTELTNHLGGEDVAGNELKSTDCNGTNSSGFSALPGGYRNYGNGNFFNQGNYGYWWSSSPGGTVAWLRRLPSGSSNVYRGSASGTRDGFSVRLIKD